MTAPDRAEAEIVKGYLENAGVPVFLDLRNPSPSAWLFLSGDPRAPVRVFVPAVLLEAARLEMLEAGFVDDDDRSAAGASEESESGSPGPVALPTRGRGFRIARIAIGVLAVLAILWLLLAQAASRATCLLLGIC